MLEIEKIESAGYAGATEGGVSFIVTIKGSENRFQSSEGKKIYLNIVVLNNPKEEMIFRLLTREYFDDGSYNHFGTKEELTTEEINDIKEWCKKNEIKKESERIAIGYNKEMETFFYWGDKITEFYDDMMNGKIKNSLERRNEFDEVILKAEEARKRANVFEDIKYV
jgi:hypothetical protein